MSSEMLEEKMRAADGDFRLGGGAAKKPVLIIGVIVAAAIAIAVLIFTGANANKVDDETAQNVLEQSDIVKNGLVPQNYVSESPYQVTKFKISDQKDTGKNANRSSISRLVTYEATIENDSFSSDIVGTMELSKVGDRWAVVDEPLTLNLLEEKTKPIKGVDRIDYSQDDSDQNDNVEYSDFESTLSADGYSAVATEKVSYNYWFAVDKATRSRAFKFDQNWGWVPSGGIEMSDEKTEWNLAGRSFSYDDAGNNSDVVSTFKVSLTFGEVKDSDLLSADHDISLKTVESVFRDQFDANGHGVASGEISHDFGKSLFTVTLKDLSSNLTYWLEGYSKSKVNLDCIVGQGDEQYYQVSLKENGSGE